MLKLYYALLKGGFYDYDVEIDGKVTDRGVGHRPEMVKAFHAGIMATIGGVVVVVKTEDGPTEHVLDNAVVGSIRSGSMTLDQLLMEESNG